jgi:hypothetical protein
LRFDQRLTQPFVLVAAMLPFSVVFSPGASNAFRFTQVRLTHDSLRNVRPEPTAYPCLRALIDWQSTEDVE